MLEWLSNPLVRELFQALPFPTVMLIIALAYKRQAIALFNTHLATIQSIPRIEKATETLSGIPRIEKAIETLSSTMEMMAQMLGHLTTSQRKDVVLVIEDERADQLMIDDTLRQLCEERGLRLMIVPAVRYAQHELDRKSVV